MDKINPIVYVVKRVDTDSERMTILDSWDSVCDVLCQMDGQSDFVQIYRCKIQSTKK